MLIWHFQIHETITAQTVSSVATGRAFNGGVQMAGMGEEGMFESIEEQIIEVSLKR